MLERIQKVLSEVLGVPPEAVTPDSDHESLAGWDSLRQMDIILALEDEFGVEFDPMAALKMSSVRAIMDAVADKAPNA